MSLDAPAQQYALKQVAHTHLAVTLSFNTPTSQSLLCSSAYTSRVLQGDTLTLHAGSPLSVIHHLQLGVWSFLASPAQGLKEGTRGGRLNLPRLADGFVEGARSLASNVVLAVSSATAKTTSAARKALISLGLDQLEVTGQLQSVLLHMLFLGTCLCYKSHVNKSSDMSPASAAAPENTMLTVTQDDQPQSKHNPAAAQQKQDAASECLTVPVS